MTRTTDPEPEPYKPFGEKVLPQKPKLPEWEPLRDSPGIERSRVTGQLRTNRPPPR